MSQKPQEVLTIEKWVVVQKSAENQDTVQILRALKMLHDELIAIRQLLESRK